MVEKSKIGRRVLSKATQKKRIQKMEVAARACGHTGKIKKSHILRIPEIRNILHPDQEVAFHVLTVKVLEDGLIPLVTIDVFVKDKMITIDLAKLQLSRANKCFLNSLNVLPRRYFKNIENTISNKDVLFGESLVGYTEEYYPSCAAN
ncbi:MAG: hypothetical protein PHE20_00515 [Patescibacteria group bacterium]|nr:hypothetical protein [Patescibacteria group bacterium]